MARIAFMEMLVLIGVVGIILSIVLIWILAGRKKKQPAVPAAQPAPTLDPAERNRQREAILERLAAKELSREESEQQLLALDKPLPEQMPTPPRNSNGCKSGCLVAGVIGAVVAAIILILLFLMFFGIKVVA